MTWFSDNVGRLSGEVGGDDDLDVGRDRGHGIDADVEGCPDSCRDEDRGEEQDHRFIANGQFDNF